MARVIYGLWDGTLYDNRGKGLFEIPDVPGFEGIDVFNQGNPVKAFFGDRGFFVFEPGVNLLDALWRYMDKAADESCGKCTPCRVGTGLIRDWLGALCNGAASGPESLDSILELAKQVRATSLCGLGQSCTVALLACLEHFRDMLMVEIASARSRRPSQPCQPDSFGTPSPFEKSGQRVVQHGMTYVTAPCIEACPAKVNVPRYIDYVRDGMPSHSLGIILQKYPMAATCGRVCVRFCEQACRRGLVDEPVGIKVLKRYVADHESHLAQGWFSPEIVTSPKPAHMKVAIIGAGPAGLSCAYHLLLKGYPVEVFEARDEAGGMAACGIPSYRLPKDVLKTETDIIERLGGQFHYGQRLGRDFSLDDLSGRGFKAVYLAVGCAQGRLMRVEGESPALQGYQPGIEFLLRVHDHVEAQSQSSLSGRVVVVGGGNVAMDCVRSALRMGADEVHLVYRRTRDAMPADMEEIEAAEKEGVIFHYLAAPSRIIREGHKPEADDGAHASTAGATAEGGRITGIELVRMRVDEPDARGRCGVVPIPGSEFVLDCDLLIPAIGQQLASGTLGAGDRVNLDERGWVEVDQSTLATSRSGVFAGGDCVLGPSTLIQAMANGLKGARSIDDYLRFGRVRFFPRSRMRKLIHDFKPLSQHWVDAPVKHLYRIHAQELDPAYRRQIFDEVEHPITPAEAYHEAGRCLRCYRIYSVITESAIPQIDE